MDGFQGREVDVVLFSCVRAPVASSYNTGGYGGYGGGGGGSGGIGFLADRRRMNVAITRAKRSLIVLGNARRLSSDATWKALVDHAKSRERLIPEVAAEAGGRAGRGGGGDLANAGRALCDRLEAKEDAVRGSGSVANGLSQHDANDGKKKKKKIETRETESAQQRRRRISSVGERRGGGGGEEADSGTREPDTDGGAGAGAASAAEERRQASPRERREDSRQEVDGGGSSNDSHRRQKPASHRANERGSRSGAAGREGVRGRDRDPAPPTQHERRTHRDRAGTTEAVLMGAAAGRSASAGQKRREGESNRPQKRARVANSEATRRVSTVGGGSDRDHVAGSSRAAAPAPPAGGGFLEGLLSSLNANASGISSGKEHDFRQGLRGGEVSRGLS